jgi:hypothetical protein
MNNQIKPKYLINRIYENSWDIEYSNGKVYIVDEHVFEMLINYTKKFIFINDTDTYPSYGINNKHITLIEYIFGFNHELYTYTFRTSNIFDLRHKNIKSIVPKDFIELTKNYNVVEYLTDGILVRRGKYAGEFKNPICKILNKYNKEEYLMLCNKNILCRLCPISYQKILDFEKNNTDINNKKIIWSYHTNGYILGNNSLFIHQVIMNYYWNGQGTKNKSVNHIDQDPLNNTYDNLRVVSQEVQRQNSKGIKEGTKRTRKASAQSLPEEINEYMIKKYVTYNRECYNKEKKLYREFFRVEKHPKLDKDIASSKSENVSILDKLTQVNKIVDDLENDIYPESTKEFPTYISINNYRDKPHFVYDRRIKEDGRQTLRMVLPEKYDIEEQISIFREKIKTKYDFVIETLP